MHEKIRKFALYLPVLGMLAAHSARAEVEKASAATPAWVTVDFIGLGMTASFIAIAVKYLREFVPAWNERRANHKAIAALRKLQDNIVTTAAQKDPELAKAIEYLNSIVSKQEIAFWPKMVLRLVPVLIGAILGALQVATPVGDSSNPWLFGGIGAGMAAALWGKGLAEHFNDRIFGRKDRSNDA